ncbi:MAG: hypothetical protein KJ850_03190 [Gammaproteobacteria bacterium]|nr:hypothetical protein [Gammaproteobacteria bacterium]MBU1624031.1 hypothetical protein [Gammaproteobacteria bacterium]MBU1981759.1 hypothetical protein [Gammaproteobacteria bacterium]
MKETIQRISMVIKATLSRWRKYLRRYFQRSAMQRLYRLGKSRNKDSDLTLFWVPGGMPLMLHVESTVATALKLRGTDVHAVICDGAYIACVKREMKADQTIDRWQLSCAACKSACAAVLEDMGIAYSYIGDYVSEQTTKELKQVAAESTWQNLDGLSYGGVNVGRNARSAILRYLQGNSFQNDVSVVREYAFSALLCAAASAEAFERLMPARVLTSHGTYVDWGPALHTALAKQIPVVAWMASYLPVRFYLRHIEDGLRLDFHNLSAHAWDECSHLELADNQSARLDQFLQNRYLKDASFDMKRFKEYTGQANLVRRKYGLDAVRPVWGIMTHINWDSVSDFSPMVYESFDEWVVDTIQQIIDVSEVQWIVKVHPAEAWENPDSGVASLIKRHFPVLPEHIRVIAAEEELSPLDFFQLIDGGITVYGTAGLESALQGKPIILAGEAHYGNKGFTYDSNSQKEYREWLQRASALPPLNIEQIELARRYAYCYFIQRQIPLSVLRDPQSKWWSFQFAKKEMLLEGRDPVVDFVCERIMDGKDFIMDERLLSLVESGDE